MQWWTTNKSEKYLKLIKKLDVMWWSWINVDNTFFYVIRFNQNKSSFSRLIDSQMLKQNFFENAIKFQEDEKIKYALDLPETKSYTVQEHDH